jgi:3-deoxy-D-manno-octulosonic-acid transferase
LLLYVLFIRLFALVMRIAAAFNTKARAWVDGRKNWAKQLEEELAAKGSGPWIWMHCASAGEFEQGKPVLEGLIKAYPQHRVLVSFFSPSGYVVGKKYKQADLVTYLPLDTAANAERFLDLIQPALVVFIKYDYWYFHLRETSKRGIPLLLVSAIFSRRQPFFKWYGGLHRRMLHFFTWLFVQDADSVRLLQEIGVAHASANGDTRFDRVAHITQNLEPIPVVEAFIQGEAAVVVAGSTWPEDEALLEKLPWEENLKLIIAPHEIDRPHIESLRQRFGTAAITYSEASGNAGITSGKRVLLVDNFGMLSRLYRYGSVTYIGGGFNRSGIHNTLEAAAWGRPVLFGPNYQKFREAIGLIEAEAAWSVSTPPQLSYEVSQLLQDPSLPALVGARAGNYVKENIGASGRVLRYIQEKRLLTRL